MDNHEYSLAEIERIVQQVAEQMHCQVVSWRYDPGDVRHLLVTARLADLPPEDASIALEVLLPPSESPSVG